MCNFTSTLQSCVHTDSVPDVWNTMHIMCFNACLLFFKDIFLNCIITPKPNNSFLSFRRQLINFQSELHGNELQATRCWHVQRRDYKLRKVSLYVNVQRLPMR